MLCSDQIAQLSEIESQLNDLNAELFIIGSSTIEQAAAARASLNSPFVFLVDPDRKSFKAAKMRKDLGSTFNFRTVPAIVRAWRNGHRQSRLQGDPFQQGGAVIILPNDTIALEFISQFGGDHPLPQQIIDHLPQQ
jgi:hypothetical protein